MRYDSTKSSSGMIRPGAVYPTFGRSPEVFAFTLIELMVVIAVIAIVAGLLLPVLGRGKSKGQSVQCMNNLRNLQIGWMMYADDHEQRLAPNSDQPTAGKDEDNPSWVAGWLRNDSDPGSKYDSTNTDLLIGFKYQAFGSIGAYTKSPNVYRCPGDRSRVTIDGVSHERVRSTSMNCYMNGNGIWQSSNHITFRKYGDIVSPATMWVFMDERDDSINDGYFAVDMTREYSLIDIPANYHSGAGCLTFADGHAEKRLWVESRPPYDGLPKFTSADDRDLAWLTRRTTIPKQKLE